MLQQDKNISQLLVFNKYEDKSMVFSPNLVINYV